MIENNIFDLNRYQIVKSIGKGQSGKVYLIKNQETKKLYTAKIYQTNCVTQIESYLLKTKMELYYKVTYPAILRFIGYNYLDFNSESHPTVIMENPLNNSLQEMFDKKNFSSSTTNYIILLGIALGMNYLHTNNIVHRNLKPSNIVLDEHYYPQICDFSFTYINDEQISKFLTEKSKGTMLYIAPEIILRGPYTNKVDIYSFALIAYELIFHKRSPIQISEIEGTSNREFFESCLSQDPTKRPTFYEICQYIVNNRFLTAFPDIDYEKVDDFLNLFEDDRDALFIHALFLLSLQRGQISSEKVVSLFKKSIEKGNCDAMFQYASYLYNGQNKEEAARYFKMSADGGNAKAMNKIAMMLLNGDGIDADREGAIRYYKMSAICDNEEGIVNYGNLIESIDMKAAVRFYKIFADRGNSTSMYRYAELLYSMESRDEEEEVIRYFKKSADLGSSDAMNSLAFILKDTSESIRYYKLSIERGNDEAMNNYAYMLDNGYGVEIDKEEAARYYKKAIDKGNVNAINNYASMKLNSNDYEEAARYYKLAIEKGSDYAMNNYATMLAKGIGVTVNKNEAIHYYRMAIEKGNVSSMSSFASMLEKGDGTKIDLKEAARYYKMAADRGDSWAMYDYARLIERGSGGVMNAEEARRYYKMSADCGNRLAKAKISSCNIY